MPRCALHRGVEAVTRLQIGSAATRFSPMFVNRKEPVKKRRCTASGARLIAKVHQVDPLVGTLCGQKMQTIAFLTDQVSIRRILHHLPWLDSRSALRDRRSSSASPRRNFATASSH